MKHLVLAALLGTLCAPPAMAETVATPAPAASPTDPAGGQLPLGEDKALRLTVPVMINGQGPFNFTIDTGADRTVISKELAERLNLPAGGKARLHAMGGQADVRLVKVEKLQVSTNIARDIKAAALPVRNLGADGLLGIDSLKGQRIVIDFAAETMRLEPSTVAEEVVANAGELIVVTARTRLGQLVLVDADANGQKVWVVVDTGSSNSIGNTKLRKLLVRRDKRTVIKPIEMVDVLGKRTPADYTVVDRLRIGGILMGGAAVAFADAHPFKIFDLTGKPSMLLGIDGLRSFRRVSVDFSSRKVKFLLPGTSSKTEEGEPLTAAMP